MRRPAKALARDLQTVIRTRGWLAGQAWSRDLVHIALGLWASLTVATPPRGMSFTISAVNRDGTPVILEVTVHMLPTPDDDPK